MAYIDSAYIKARVDDKTLEKVTKEAGGTGIDEALITARIGDAESIVDAKIGSRYTTPLTVIPDNIKQITYDITMYLLYKTHRTHKMDEEIKFGYEQAIRELNRIEDGKSNLVGISEISTSPSRVIAQTNAPTEKRFSKELFDTYR